MRLHDSWKKVLEQELRQPYIKELIAFLEAEWASNQVVYPPKELIFHAFSLTPFESVKVVIVGQDPYHGPGQAHGLCFSVPEGIPPPPSLKNIFKELHDDLNLPIPKNGNLESWAKQGVLLLNATLTVRQSAPLSHHNRGWERFTDAVIRALVQRKDPLIFVLWGSSAQQKLAQIHAPQLLSHHKVLTAAHPSPFSAYRGFFGCRHFSQINSLLQDTGKTPIEWILEKF